MIALDPTRQAILQAAYSLGWPQQLAHRPAEAARLIAQLEFLAVDLRWNLRWVEFSPLVSLAFEQARPEWRHALGIAAAAEPQTVITAMLALERALRAGDVKSAESLAASAPFTRGAEETLARLGHLPPLPRAAHAAALAQNELLRRHDNGHRWWVSPVFGRSCRWGMC